MNHIKCKNDLLIFKTNLLLLANYSLFLNIPLEYIRVVCVYKTDDIISISQNMILDYDFHSSDTMVVTGKNFLCTIGINVVICFRKLMMIILPVTRTKTSRVRMEQKNCPRALKITHNTFTLLQCQYAVVIEGGHRFRQVSFASKRKEFITSKRGKKMILINGFKFNFSYKSVQTNISRYRYFVKTCTAIIYVDYENVLISKTFQNVLEHKCNGPCSNVDRQKVTSACKRKAVDDINEKPQKIILNEIQLNNSVSNFTVNDVSAIRQSIYRARKHNTDTSTSNGEEFLLINDQNTNIIIFSCETNLIFLCQSHTIFVDGTFEYCPKYFTQLFTIHSLKNNFYVPLVFCLLKNKSYETFTQAFKYIQNKCNEKNLTFNPKNVTVDFEISIHNAILSVWPSTNIIGCCFHLTQAWYRKIQELGLSTEYKENWWLRTTFGLTFLDPQKVSELFVEDFMSIIPEGSEYCKYADYLTDNYISENSIASISGTTNNCESFHAHFNELFYKSHPHINIFLKILISNVQNNTYIQINSCNLGIQKSVRCNIKKRLINTTNAIEKYENKKFQE
ncbi:hypothetical protein AGLY_017672 [Aphis glycines]|uniref:MULE transposase domain-containing protein n=1 Tax=Aphis glycines TaxID=307491 RepID=A0A6G0SUW0_APHGL|nr:hypothetical protein AGLY_017672 [Aphis glycines]